MKEIFNGEGKYTYDGWEIENDFVSSLQILIRKYKDEYRLRDIQAILSDSVPTAITEMIIENYCNKIKAIKVG